MRLRKSEEKVMKILTMMVASLFTMGLFAFDAEARRMGGGANIGKQRQAISQQQAAPKPPAQQQQQQAAPANAPAQQAAGGSKWLGPLAGLALGAGLFALFLNNGIAGVLAGLAMIALIIAVALYLARMVRGRPATARMQYAGAGTPGSGEVPRFGPMPVGAAPFASATTGGHWPADFDAAEFVRHARLNFVRLQEVHDRKDLETMRDYLTPEVYREIEAGIRAAGDARQTTDVVTLNAEVLDVVEENGLYVVSVRFSGLIREDEGAEPAEFSEIWHLEKPVTGRSGWLVAGIQQS
jgi:predicted lipid-binding transport protein (Tim44 family)